MKTIAEEIIETLAETGVRQSEIAALAHVRVSSINNLIKGRQRSACGEREERIRDALRVLRKEFESKKQEEAQKLTTEDICQLFSDYIIEYGISQKKAATLTNIPEANIRRILKGKKPRTKTCKKIQTFLDLVSSPDGGAKE